MIGDKDHPEVKAIAGWADDVVVAGNSQDLANINISRKCGVICQTTQSPEHFGEMVSQIVQRNFGEIKIINTLCQETRKRQDCSVELCKQVDIMFVLGGLNSANTRKLADLCRKYNNQTYHIQNITELDYNWLKGKKTAGVTAGASTPDWVIDDFVDKLSQF
jgi:4-hydroxy-3-methylbut-2-enyl diphosphate reductase